jgi:osmotically-inducible protein OsmY
MNKTRRFATLTLVTALTLGGLLAGSITACTSSRTSESTGEYIDDSVISNKVRGEIVGDKDLSIFQIDVEAYKGVVQLSGFVNSQAAKNRAGTVAAGVKGVKQVRNNLVVK